MAKRLGSEPANRMLCWGRFTGNERPLYHAKEERPPFHAVGPALPPDYQQGKKFCICTRCEALSLAEVEALEPYRDNVWSLTLLGPECNDSTLERLPAFPAMQVLELTHTATTGPGLGAPDRQPKMRVLNVLVQHNQRFDLGMLPRLPSLNTLIVWHAPSLSFDFGHSSPATRKQQECGSCPSPQEGLPQPSLSNRDDGLILAGTFILAMLAFFRSYDLALVAMVVIGAALLWMLARRRGRNHFLSAAGWLLGGLAAVRTGWPASQKLDLLMVIGGLATAVQGAWEIPHMSRMFQSRRQSSAT